MTRKEQLRNDYKEKFGVSPEKSMTIEKLEKALSIDAPTEEKEVEVKKDPKVTKLKPVKGKVFITNGKVKKYVTSAQWRNMKDFKHNWKEVLTEPVEVQKLKNNGKDKK